MSKNKDESNKMQKDSGLPDMNELNQLIGYEKEHQNIQSLADLNDESLIKDRLKYQKLLFSHNKLWDISEFFGFENVVYLDLNHNNLQKIDSLSSLGNLEILILGNNFLKTVGFSLVTLKRLQHLDLSYNKIETNNDTLIKVLKFNTELVSLVLTGNPSYVFEDVKFKCLEVLGKLEYLDAEQILKPKKQKFINHSYIVTKGIKGNTKKCRNIAEYVKFKQDDFANNKNEYRDDWIKKEKFITDVMNQNCEHGDVHKGSFYYFSYLNNQKFNK